MKKLFQSITLFLMLASGVFFSCTQAGDEPEIPKADIEINPKIQGVIALANSEAERLFPAQSRAEKRVATARGIKTICNRESRGQNDTLVYVVNYENNNGFALISAVGNSQPVLAVVPNGSYDPEIGTDNPGFNLFMDAATNYVLNDTTKKLDPITGPDYPMDINGKYVKIEKKEVTHYGPAKRISIPFCWGQDGIYGDYCPNKVSGCAPLAVASIITWAGYFYGYDGRFNYTYPKADIPYEYIEWIEVFRHHSSAYTYSDGWSIDHVCWAADKDAVHKTIGRLCRQIGYSMNADYKKIQTETSIISETSVRRNIAHVILKQYLPEQVIRLGDFDGFGQMRLIDKGILYIEAARKNDINNGHSWVCDGYEYIKTEVKKYEADPPAPGLRYEWKLASTTYEEKMLSYMRWGWHGRYDGWYASKVLTPGNNSYVDATYVAVCSE